jgi:C-terminal processing protease CtpA/Prc
MKRLNKWAAVLGLAALVAAPAWAGHEKCNASTQECLDKMAAHMKNSGWVGVELEPSDEGGYSVAKVIPGSPAEEAGIRAGDVLFAMNGIKISEENEAALMKVKKDLSPGKSVDYTIKRDGYDRQVTVTLAPMPADVLARYVGQHMLEHASAGLATGK